MYSDPHAAASGTPRHVATMYGAVPFVAQCGAPHMAGQCFFAKSPKMPVRVHSFCSIREPHAASSCTPLQLPGVYLVETVAGAVVCGSWPPCSTVDVADSVEGFDTHPMPHNNGQCFRAKSPNCPNKEQSLSGILEPQVAASGTPLQLPGAYVVVRVVVETVDVVVAVVNVVDEVVVVIGHSPVPGWQSVGPTQALPFLNDAVIFL